MSYVDVGQYFFILFVRFLWEEINWNVKKANLNGLKILFNGFIFFGIL